MKFRTSARVIVTLELDVTSSWNEGMTIEQVRHQAIESVRSALQRAAPEIGIEEATAIVKILTETK